MFAATRPGRGAMVRAAAAAGEVAGVMVILSVARIDAADIRRILKTVRQVILVERVAMHFFFIWLMER